jgi:aconitate hydratase
VILKIAGELTVKGGTGYLLEYFGPGTETLSATGMATICNMGAEVGATTSIFPYTEKMGEYLCLTGRRDVYETCESFKDYLSTDPGFKPEQVYDKILSINLSEIEPHINGPFSPDVSTPLSKFAQTVKEKGWPEKISAGLIGSCTNSSYEDMTRAVHIVKQGISLL